MCVGPPLNVNARVQACRGKNPKDFEIIGKGGKNLNLISPKSTGAGAAIKRRLPIGELAGSFH